MGLNLNFKKYGDSGENIVILHGLFGMMDNWHYHAKEFSKDFTVYTLDLRNHGNSPHDDGMSYELMAEDLETFCETHQLNKINLLGHSMGGKAAMQFAIDFPHKLSKLIIADIGSKAYPEGHQIYFKAFREIDFASLKSRKEADEAFAAYESNPIIRLFLLKNIASKPEGGYQLKCNIEAIEKGYSAISGKINIPYPINIPTLFMKGKRSDYIMESDEVEILKDFPNVLFKTIPDAGHWLHADNPEGFSKVLKAFLLNMKGVKES